MATTQTANNPYRTIDGSPRMLPSIVCYLDILGYRQLVGKAIASNPDALLHLRIALDAAYPHLAAWFGVNTCSIPVWNAKTFTDNIVLAEPIRLDGEAQLGTISECLGFFQLELIKHGIFVRGALTVDDFYMDEEIAFGPGLVQSVNAENDTARDPRIILLPPAVDMLRHHCSKYVSPDDAPQNQCFARDADNQIFVNYLEPILIAEHEQGPYVEWMKYHRDMVVSKLREYSDQPVIWSKYRWVANYHDWFCECHEHWFDTSYNIPKEYLRSHPTHLRGLVD